ncbi:glycosyltransferase, partial [Escherichia coli]
MKNILIVTPEIPYPAFKGNQNRIHQTIKLLESLNCKISLAILNSNQKERKSIDVKKDVLKAYKLSDVIVKRHPKFSKDNVFSALKKIDESLFGTDRICTQETCPYTFKKVVRKYIKTKSPDYVIVNYLKISDVIPRGYKGKTIVDTHDFATEIMKGALKIKPNDRFDLAKFEKSERKCINKFDTVIAINPNEEKEFKRRFGIKNTVFIPGFHNVKTCVNRDSKHKYDILFVGSSSPFNIEGFMKFNANVIPQLSKLLGKMPLIAVAGDVSNCAAIKKIKGNHINRLGRVPDLSECYNSAKVVICPILNGAGMKIKSVEALSYGKAMVTTTLGCDGINIKNGVHAIIADQWHDFTSALYDILTHNEKRIQLEENALQLAKDEYSFESVAIKWREILELPRDNICIKQENSIRKTPVNESKTPSRKKALIFGMDARLLMDINLHIAMELRRQGVFSEIVKVESAHKNFFMQHDFITHSLKEMFTKKNRDLAEEWYRENHELPIAKMSYRGVNIGVDILTHKRMFPEHYEKDKFSKSIKYCILLIETLLNLCEKIRPDFLVSWNGNGPHMIFIPKIVAKIIDVPVLFVERGLLPSTYLVDYQGVNFKSYLAGSYIDIPPNNKFHFADNYIKNFSDANETIVNTNDLIISDKQRIFQKLKIKNKGFILFCEQIEGDSNIIINSPKFKKMRQVINELMPVAKKLGFSLVIRPHPENKKRQIDYPAGCIINSDINLHSLLKASEFNVVINSTVGLESLILNKLTFVLGNSIYTGKGFTYDVRSGEEIISLYREFAHQSDDEKYEKELKFKSFLIYLLCNYLVHYKDSSYDEITYDIFENILIRLGFEYRLKTNPKQTKACQYLVGEKNKINFISGDVAIINTVNSKTKLYYT